MATSVFANVSHFCHSGSSSRHGIQTTSRRMFACTASIGLRRCYPARASLEHAGIVWGDHLIVSQKAYNSLFMARDPVNLHLVSPMPSRNKSFFNDPRSRTKITDHKIITILTPAEAVPQSGCGRAQCASVKRVCHLATSPPRCSQRSQKSDRDGTSENETRSPHIPAMRASTTCRSWCAL